MISTQPEREPAPLRVAFCHFIENKNTLVFDRQVVDEERR